MREIANKSAQAEKLFNVFCVMATPGIATVRACSEEEALEKAQSGEFEDYEDNPLAAEIEFDEVEEVDEHG